MVGFGSQVTNGQIACAILERVKLTIHGDAAFAHLTRCRDPYLHVPLFLHLFEQQSPSTLHGSFFWPHPSSHKPVDSLQISPAAQFGVF